MAISYQLCNNIWHFLFYFHMQDCAMRKEKYISGLWSLIKNKIHPLFVRLGMGLSRAGFPFGIFLIYYFHCHLCHKRSYQHIQAFLAMIIAQIPYLSLLTLNYHFYVSYQKFLLENLNKNKATTTSRKKVKSQKLLSLINLTTLINKAPGTILQYSPLQQHCPPNHS